MGLYVIVCGSVAVCVYVCMACSKGGKVVKLPPGKMILLPGKKLGRKILPPIKIIYYLQKVGGNQFAGNSGKLMQW